MNTVSQGLNLVLKLRSDASMDDLLRRIRIAQAAIDKGFDELSMVHFARFLPTYDKKALQVITEFDGPLASYVLDFAIEIGDVFDMLLRETEGAEHLIPIKDHPTEFLAFVQRNNLMGPGLPPGAPPSPWPLFSAYRDSTVIDIVGARTAPPTAKKDREATPVETSDVQGNILKGYRAERVTHFMLRVKDGEAGTARAWLVKRASDEPDPTVPDITSAKEWRTKPAVMLNVGLTASGMAALGIRESWRAPFPTAFREGALERAKGNFDVDRNAPEHWWLGGPGQDIHLMVSLYQGTEKDAAAFETAHRSLVDSLKASGLDVVDSQDGQLQGGGSPLGYADGVAHPRVAGDDPPARDTDLQPASTAGEFVLGSTYRNIYGGSSLGRLPEALAANGTFCAVRVIAQDRKVFDAALDQQADALCINRNWLAAKLMGRWFEGAPVSLHPETSPIKGSGEHKRNDFDYAPSAEHPDSLMDHGGLRCPVGAHIRRGNPRTARVTGARYTRRLMRRGMNYTRTFDDPKGGEARTEVGLFGLFICADLERQFEFIQRQWLNGDTFAPGIRDTRDPFGGTPIGEHHEFNIPMDGTAPLKVQLPQFVHTRGSLYLFMPGLAALRQLETFATTEPGPSMVAARTSLEFDSRQRAFQIDPYPVFARFRIHEPVHYSPLFQGWFVFDHAGVLRICDEARNFHGEAAPGLQGDRGLFTLDEPHHGNVLKLVAGAWFKAAATAKSRTDVSIGDTLKRLASRSGFDLVDDFARPVPRNVYFDILGGNGITSAARDELDDLARTVMKLHDHTLDEKQLAMGEAARFALFLKLSELMDAAHPDSTSHADFEGSFLAHLAPLVDTVTDSGRLTRTTVVKTLVNVTVAGYMSVEFLLATGIRRLLLDKGHWWEEVRSGGTSLHDFVQEMLRCEHALAVVDRFTANDIEIGGVAIPRGSRVFGVLASANRDEKVFPDGDTFKPGRINAEAHLGFGHGVHACMGRALEKLITGPAIQALMDAMPNLRLATDDEPPWFTNFYFRSFDHLPVTA